MELSNVTRPSRPKSIRNWYFWGQKDSLPYIACFTASIVFAGFAFNTMIRRRFIDEMAHRPIPLSMKASVLLAGRNQFKGDSGAKHTLVEFGDYECPPCRAAQNRLSMALTKWQGRVRLDFRQFPLTQIHPHAEEAAVAAESAYLRGKYWVLHDRLFTANLTDANAVADCLDQAHLKLSKAVARKQLAADVAVAKQLGVSSTPSFVLCCPDGRVLLMRNLTDVDRTIK